MTNIIAALSFLVTSCAESWAAYRPKPLLPVCSPSICRIRNSPSRNEEPCPIYFH